MLSSLQRFAGRILFDKLNDYDMDEEKDQHIREHFRIPGTEPLLAFRKTEPGTPWKYGVTITGGPLAFATIHFTASGREPLSLWPDCLNCNSLCATKRSMSAKKKCSAAETPLRCTPCSAISAYAASLTAADNPVRYPYDASYAPRWNLPVRNTEEERWIVAEGGMLRGVHSESELTWAADTGQLAPARTRCWKKGLPAWISAEAAGFV